MKHTRGDLFGRRCWDHAFMRIYFRNHSPRGLWGTIGKRLGDGSGGAEATIRNGYFDREGWGAVQLLASVLEAAGGLSGRDATQLITMACGGDLTPIGRDTPAWKKYERDPLTDYCAG